MPCAWSSPWTARPRRAWGRELTPAPRVNSVGHGDGAARRTFEVAVPLERAWRRWRRWSGGPSWAPHITAGTVTPPGPSGRRPPARCTSADWAQHVPHGGVGAARRWAWVGGLPGVRIDYEHRFAWPARTRPAWSGGHPGRPPRPGGAAGLRARLRPHPRPRDPAPAGVDHPRALIRGRGLRRPRAAARPPGPRGTSRSGWPWQRSSAGYAQHQQGHVVVVRGVAGPRRHVRPEPAAALSASGACAAQWAAAARAARTRRNRPPRRAGTPAHPSHPAVGRPPRPAAAGPALPAAGRTPSTTTSPGRRSTASPGRPVAGQMPSGRRAPPAATSPPPLR